MALVHALAWTTIYRLWPSFLRRWLATALSGSGNKAHNKRNRVCEEQKKPIRTSVFAATRSKQPLRTLLPCRRLQQNHCMLPALPPRVTMGCNKVRVEVGLASRGRPNPRRNQARRHDAHLMPPSCANVGRSTDTEDITAPDSPRSPTKWPSPAFRLPQVRHETEGLQATVWFGYSQSQSENSSSSLRNEVKQNKRSFLSCTAGGHYCAGQLNSLTHRSLDHQDAGGEETYLLDVRLLGRKF